MSDNSKRQQDAGDAPQADAASPPRSTESAADAANEAAAAEGGQAQAAPDDGEAALREQLAAAEAKANEQRDAYLRTAAELENVRRRAERDVANAHKFGLEKFASELLGVRDSLELGLDSANGEAATVEKVREGMELTLKQLAGAMDKFGIRQIDPAGLPFDPEQHEAVAMVPKADVDPNTVVDVMQRGYALNERLLRAAMVTVAKAPPAETADEQ